MKKDIFYKYQKNYLRWYLGLFITNNKKEKQIIKIYKNIYIFINSSQI